MTSKADQLLAALGEARRKHAAADRAVSEAEGALDKAWAAYGDAVANLRAARAAIENEAAGL